MLIEDLIKRKQEGVEYSRDKNNDIIMKFTDYNRSYKLIQCYDEKGNPFIDTYIYLGE